MSKMFLTTAEAKQKGLGTVAEQIEKHNARVRAEKREQEYYQMGRGAGTARSSQYVHEHSPNPCPVK